MTAPGKKISLSKLIFRQYARSALFVILTIEVLLLVMYFGINAYISSRTKETLTEEVKRVVPNVVSLSADVIEGVLTAIADKTRFFAETHVRLFSHPESFPVDGEKPVFEEDPMGKGTIYQSNLTNGSSFYIPKTSVGHMGPAQWLFATNSAALNPIYRQMVGEHVVAAYVNVDEPADMNRLYPYIKEVWKQYPDDLDMKKYNFYYLADKDHTEKDKPRWTGLYVDPAGQGWMFSCIAPVYVGDNLEAVVGLDVTLNKIAERIKEMELPWKASALLVAGKSDPKDSSDEEKGNAKPGLIIAASDRVWGLLSLQEPERNYDYKTHGPVSDEKLAEGNILDLPDPALSQGLRGLFDEPSIRPRLVGSSQGSLLVANARIPSTGWQFFMLVEPSEIFDQIDHLARISRWIGLAAVAVMAIFYAAFFLWLRERAARMAKDISKPLEELSLASADVATSTAKISIPTSGIEEIDQLGTNFKKMASELDERTKELVKTRVDSEMKTKNAELAHALDLYNSAAANLHDAGNAVTALESSLLDLKKFVKSTEQYPEVFKRLKEGGAASAGLLGRFEEVLVGKAVPRLDSLSKSIDRLKDTIKMSIREQQAIFRRAREQGGFKQKLSQASQPIDLTAMLGEMCGVFCKDYPAIDADLAPGIVVRNHKTPLWAGIDNIIRNAIDASPRRGPIRVQARMARNGATVIVTDQGEGILPENLGKVGERGFTTKKSGHGLGLSGFKEFLEIFGGGLTIRSEGPGQGTEITVEIRNA